MKQEERKECQMNYDAYNEELARVKVAESGAIGASRAPSPAS